MSHSLSPTPLKGPSADCVSSAPLSPFLAPCKSSACLAESRNLLHLEPMQIGPCRLGASRVSLWPQKQFSFLPPPLLPAASTPRERRCSRVLPVLLAITSHHKFFSFDGGLLHPLL